LVFVFGILFRDVIFGEVNFMHYGRGALEKRIIREAQNKYLNGSGVAAEFALEKRIREEVEDKCFHESGVIANIEKKIREAEDHGSGVAAEFALEKRIREEVEDKCFHESGVIADIEKRIREAEDRGIGVAGEIEGFVMKESFIKDNDRVLKFPKRNFVKDFLFCLYFTEKRELILYS
jgi:hypothetical protein